MVEGFDALFSRNTIEKARKMKSAKKLLSLIGIGWKFLVCLNNFWLDNFT